MGRKGGGQPTELGSLNGIEDESTGRQKAREMKEKAQIIRNEVLPERSYGQQLVNFLDEAYQQYEYVGRFR